MDPWQDILRTALVGTDRQPPTLPTPPGDLGLALSSLPPTNPPEKNLLGAAALLSLYQSAGHLPTPAGMVSSADHVSPPAPDETLPPLPPKASTHLPDLLTGPQAPLLPEFLTACAASNRRIPRRYLPDLLDRAASQPDLRPLVLPVIGERGLWLLGQNPAWNFAKPTPLGVEPTTLDLWQTGTHDQRLSLLRHLRSTNPASARDLLRSTWPQDPPEDRAAFLPTFATNLSADDEPFLEEALDDRRKEVRTVAADLLSRLPTSQLVSRMLARLKPLIRIDITQPGKLKKLLPGQHRKISLDVTPPDTCDKPCIRDGIDPKPPLHSGIGEKAWLLRQMLSLIPPTAWSTGTDLTPEELLTAAENTEWSDALLYGWTRAAARHPDPVWSSALLIAHLNPPKTKKSLPPLAQVANQETLKELVASLPTPELESTLIAALESNDDKLSSHPALPLLRTHDRPWGRDLSLAILTRLRAEATGRADYALWQWIQQDLGRLLSPDTAPLANDPNWQPPREWESPLSHMRSTLQFRHDMLASLKE